MAETPVVPWQDSFAKQILVQEILEGAVTTSSNPDLVYFSHAEFQVYKKSNFKANLKSLIKSLSNKEERALFDAAAIAHDCLLYPRNALTVRGYPFWDTSDAKVLLTSDIDEGRHLEMKPLDLWNTREEYKLFPLQVFRKHLYDERDKPKTSGYWEFKRQNKNKKTRK
jgi:hypothetical protein